MSLISTDLILATFVVFCRVGACLMIMPGFSSSRIPMQVRLFVVIGLSLAMSPMLMPSVMPALAGTGLAGLVGLIVTESLIGAQFGIVGRLFFLALQTIGQAIAMFMGFGMMAGVAIDEPDPVPALTSFMMLTATALLFITDQHWEIIRGLAGTYVLLPPLGGFDAQFSLIRIADTLSEAFVLALQIASPFLVFSFILNFAMGVMNKMIPQVPVYFVSLPFLIAGGLMIFYFLSDEIFVLFNQRFGAWLAGG
ncbi:MAG: flagellar biosynthetic protein FliR [Salinarimonas sp.]